VAGYFSQTSEPSLAVLQDFVGEANRLNVALTGLAELLERVKWCIQWIGSAKKLLSAIQLIQAGKTTKRLSIRVLETLMTRHATQPFQSPEVTAIKIFDGNLMDFRKNILSAIKSDPSHDQACDIIQQATEMFPFYDIPECLALGNHLKRIEWRDHITAVKRPMSIQQANEIIDAAANCGIAESEPALLKLMAEKKSAVDFAASVDTTGLNGGFSLQSLDRTLSLGRRLHVIPDILHQLRDARQKFDECSATVVGLFQSQSPLSLVQAQALLSDCASLPVRIDTGRLEMQIKSDAAWMDRATLFFGCEPSDLGRVLASLLESIEHIRKTTVYSVIDCICFNNARNGTLIACHSCATRASLGNNLISGFHVDCVATSETSSGAWTCLVCRGYEFAPSNAHTLGDVTGLLDIAKKLNAWHFIQSEITLLTQITTTMSEWRDKTVLRLMYEHDKKTLAFFMRQAYAMPIREERVMEILITKLALKPHESRAYCTCRATAETDPPGQPVLILVMMVR
jgi:hypothetical protein